MEYFKRIDKKKIPADQSEVRCFCVGRNELQRLPFFLKYHKDIGIDRFFFIDNESTDNSIEYLLTQNNVHIWKTNQLYHQSEFGRKWLRIVAEKHGFGHWSLFLDIDEFFFFPHCDKGIKIQVFINSLEAQKKSFVSSIMLDMYSDKSIKDTSVKKNDNLFKICPFFDRPDDIDLFFNTIRGAPVHRKSVRSRVFSIPANIRKFIFVKYSKEMELSSKQHHFDWDVKDFSPLRTILFHFKFLNNFSRYVRESIERDCHWNHSIEYKAYQSKLFKFPNLSLYDKLFSIKFKDTNDLINRGILTDIPYKI